MNKQNFMAKQVQEMAVKYGVGGCEGQKRALCVDGAQRWYALTVAPQREDQAEAWLARYADLERKVNDIIDRGIRHREELQRAGK